MSKWPYSTKAWQGLRAAKLSIEPICEVCKRREVVQVATVVDHIIAINKGGPAFPPLSGLMSMCAPCHNIKTNAVDHPSATGHRRAFKGFDVDGNPIDPEGWERADGQRHGEQGLGGLGGREIEAAGPAWDTNKDIVSKLPNQEGFKWV